MFVWIIYRVLFIGDYGFLCISVLNGGDLDFVWDLVEKGDPMVWRINNGDLLLQGISDSANPTKVLCIPPIKRFFSHQVSFFEGGLSKGYRIMVLVSRHMGFLWFHFGRSHYQDGCYLVVLVFYALGVGQDVAIFQAL
ncbi:unnamed protein product [Eruca vesicaria subsp. sativa]|uniref:Uncharacterized protein n=1 Tax=Eruca vesicaria subsp. sativa TaxID=29727 RepID=A0ABC8JVF4_ERUVS|nr:unnamed protein product [Eruca vesicaria subsp. sativa]